jgi:drug/metabolite transporter (DMT)-like permease
MVLWRWQDPSFHQVFHRYLWLLDPCCLVFFFWLSGRKPTKRKLLGTLLGLIGIGIMVSQKKLAIPGMEMEFFKGIFYLSVAVIGWNIGVFRIQYTQANSYHFTQVCSIQMLTGGLIVFLISTLKGDYQQLF